MPSPKTPFSIRLSKAERSELTKEAKTRGLDSSDVIRELIRDGRRFRQMAEAAPRSKWNGMLALIER